MHNLEHSPEKLELLRRIVATHQIEGFKEDLTVLELDKVVLDDGKCTIKEAISVSALLEWAIEILDRENPEEQSDKAKGPIISLAKAIKSNYGKIFTAVMGGAALASGCSTDIDHSPNGKVKSIDNDNFRTTTQGLTALDLDHLSTPTKLPFSEPGDVGVEVFKADGYIHFTFAKVDGRDYKISCQNLEDCLSATSGVKRVVGSAERTGGSEGMAHNPVTGELIRVGNDWDWEPAQKSIPTYNASTDDLILTNSTDSCEIGGSPQIMNDGVTVYSSYSRGPVDKDMLSTCDNETKPTLNGLGAPAQDPENDNLYLVGKRNQATGFVYLAYATSLADLEAGITTLIPNLVRGTLNINPTIRVIDGFKIIVWEGEDGLYYATVEKYCGDDNKDTNEDCDGGPNCTASCNCPTGQVPDGTNGCTNNPPVCGDGTVEGTELCDDENCNANCDDCNPGYELSGNLCVAQIPDQDPDLSDTTDADPDTVDPDTIDDTDTTTDTPDEDTTETTDTPDQDTPETDTTPDQSNPEIIIDPNCDPTRIAVTDVLDSGSGVEVLCPGSPVFAEIKGNGTLSLTLHEGISPATVQIGDMEGNEGKIIINQSVKEGEKSAEMDQIYGYYRFQEDEKLANGQPQLEVNYRVTGAIMTFSPIGTIFEMDKKSLDQNNIKYAGRVIESSVLATVFDENDKLLYTRVFQEGDEIYFTNTSLKSLCNESLSDFCKVIVTEDTSEGAETLEGEDVFTDTSVDKKDPGGCTCIVKSADGKLEVIPAALGLAVLGIIMQLRRRKGSEQ